MDETTSASLSGAKTASLPKPKEKANDSIDIDQYLDDSDVEIVILKDDSVDNRKRQSRCIPEWKRSLRIECLTTEAMASLLWCTDCRKKA